MFIISHSYLVCVLNNSIMTPNSEALRSIIKYLHRNSIINNISILAWWLHRLILVYFLSSVFKSFLVNFFHGCRVLFLAFCLSKQKSIELFQSFSIKYTSSCLSLLFLLGTFLRWYPLIFCSLLFMRKKRLPEQGKNSHYVAEQYFALYFSTI